MVAAHIMTDEPTEAGADQNIRSKVILAADTRKTDRGSRTVTGNTNPFFLWVLIGHRRGERPTCDRVARWKRFAAIPKSAFTAKLARAFSICRGLERLHNDGPLQNGFQSDSPGVPDLFMLRQSTETDHRSRRDENRKGPGLRNNIARPLNPWRLHHLTTNAAIAGKKNGRTDSEWNQPFHVGTSGMQRTCPQTARILEKFPGEIHNARCFLPEGIHVKRDHHGERDSHSAPTHEANNSRTQRVLPLALRF